MTDPPDSLPKHKDDFDRVYDLEDPSRYFTALRPSDYRMPAVLAGALKTIHRLVCAARGTGGALRLLDFACGYGTIGALLRHDIAMAEIYTRYGERSWRPVDARRHWQADIAFFAARRKASVTFEIGGTDIAGAALEYAAALGFLDRTFHENLIDQVPSEALTRFLHGVDLVVESGSLGDLLLDAFGRILDACADARRPWFLYCPRPDVDWGPLNALWVERGYRRESLGTEPVRYRKALAEEERADMLRVTRELGIRDEDVMRDGYLLVDMTLARPEADAGKPPIARLRRSYD
ncbi:MAG: hypothetical protein OXU81_02285 [Gammaproteobacteria bacterium]|nr:hypothetical protein [Gammaproteobacteria bacterium]